MHKVYFLIFTIPIVSFFLIGLYQVLEETFKKEFVLERRGTALPDQIPPELPKRRYADAVAEKTESEDTTQEQIAQVHGA